MGISLGLVGLGSFGRAFADLFMGHPLVDCIALCDLEPERIAAFVGKPSWKPKFDPRDACGSLDEILQTDLDALAIITQPWLHAPQCVRALEAGKHVYSAVPIISIPDGNEILGWCDRLTDSLYAYSDETALFNAERSVPTSNGATMRIFEGREIGHPEREIFRVYGTEGSFENDRWTDNRSSRELTIDEMRDPLPEEVIEAYRAVSGASDVYGGQGGSHAYLAHEFVDAVAHERTPAINAWEAVRYMAAGVMAHQSALRDGEILDVPDWGDAPS